jgi:hypothetical protein
MRVKEEIKKGRKERKEGRKGGGELPHFPVKVATSLMEGRKG